MNKIETQAFAMLGPLGSGKTTTLNNMLNVLHPEEVEQTRIVVNDVGEANIDYRRLIGGGGQDADIRALTAGCIGCSDVSQFREIVEAAKEDGVRFLLIEPTGIAPGNEIAEVVEAAGLPFSALTLVDVKHFAVHQLYDVMPSQLLVASHVGLTHVGHLDGNIWEDDGMQEVLAFIGQHAPGVQIDVMQAGTVDRDFVELQLGIKTGVRRRLGRIAVGHSCDADCQHNHQEHHHGGNIHAFSFTTDAKHPEELIEALSAFPGSHLVRAKGVVGGYRFDLVGDDMTVQEIDDLNEPVVNLIYVGEAPDFSGEERLSPLHAHQETSGKKAVVGSVRKLSSAQRETLITDHLAYYPQNVINVAGGLVVDCEADNAYEIAFWRESDDLSLGVKKLAMDAYVAHRLRALHHLTYHKDPDWKEADVAYYKRRLGASLGWNYYHLSDYMREEDRAVIGAAQPARLLLEGFMQLEVLAFDEGRAEEKPEFIRAVMERAVKEGTITLAEYQGLRMHAYELAAGNKEWTERWQNL
ncbi:MAG: GTP-binding protein [Candidatus Saccharimonadales bacterium]